MKQAGGLFQASGLDLSNTTARGPKVTSWRGDSSIISSGPEGGHKRLQ